MPATKINRLMLVLCFLFMLMFANVLTVKAYEAGELVGTTISIDKGVEEKINHWLSVDPPNGLRWWIVTDASQIGQDWRVSLVGLNEYNSPTTWRLDDGTAAWTGSITIHPDGTLQVNNRQASYKLASPNEQTGGGAVYFPWARGKSMMYGIRGVHGAGDFGTTGMYAIDWMGGDDLGSGVAGDTVYASATGTIDYVCNDGKSVAVRLQSGDDYYLYAHLQNNANLTIGHTFNARENIGSLVHGSFSGSCGSADQSDNHYHLHWMFTPDNNGYFQVEGCILDISQQTWTCGRDTRGPGEYIADDGTGSGGGGGDDPSTTNEDVTFFDFVLVGFLQFWQTIIDAMPPHETLEYTEILFNTIKLVLRISRVLVYGNINIGHLMTVIVVSLGIKIIFNTAWTVVFLYKVFKSLNPMSE